MSQLFISGGQSTGVSASASVLPMNTQDLFPLGWTGWISLQSKGLSRVFSNTTVQKHQFFGAQLSLWWAISLRMRRRQLGKSWRQSWTMTGRLDNTGWMHGTQPKTSRQNIFQEVGNPCGKFKEEKADQCGWSQVHQRKSGRRWMKRGPEWWGLMKSGHGDHLQAKGSDVWVWFWLDFRVVGVGSDWRRCCRDKKALEL